MGKKQRKRTVREDRLHITGRNYQKPYRPLLIRMVNLFGRIAALFGLQRKISAEKLMKVAVRSVRNDTAGGLSDFGPDFNIGPLQVLCRSVEEEAYLHPFGRFVTRTRLRGVLANRLRAQYWFSHYPEIEEQQLLPLTVITGLQRTGTTMLHRLLAADPDTRALLSWEAINPAPIPGLPRKEERDRRVRSAVTSQNALSYIAPDFFTVHPVEAMAPEEDCLLLDASFLSTVPEATLRVPSYSRWLETQDQRPSYEYMRKLLLLLQWQQPAKRWLLKTPHHMEYLDVLFDVFPEAKIIQTHRDPAVTLASFCSMISHGRGVFSNSVDPHEVGRDWSRKIRRMTEQTIRVRDTMPADRFYDVYYEDLTADPLGEVKKIYRYLDIPWTDEVEAVMKQTNQTNYQYKYGRHVYTLEDFGLSEESVQREFAAYYDRFINAVDTKCCRA